MLTRILLDTNVVGNHIDQTAPLIDLSVIQQRLWKYRISLPDSTAEIVEGLLQNADFFGRWQSHVAEIDAILDRRWPILPGGRELAALSGTQNDLSIDAANSQRYYQALWRLLSQARSIADLQAGIRYTDVSGTTYEVRADPNRVNRELTTERDRWSDYVEQTRNVLRNRGIASNDFAGVLAVVRGDLGSQPTDPPDLAARLDSVSRMIARFICLALPRRDAYNPRADRRRGDVFDLSLLFAVPLPAIICTSDGSFAERLRQAGAQHARQVITIAELNDRARADTLDELVADHRTTSVQVQRWREAAYINWINRGCPPNDPLTDWVACEPIA